MDRRITLRHLEAFRSLMVHRTVTRAAEALKVTQPVVTRLISDLEDRIAIPLFHRNRGRLTPTAEANLLIEEVHQSLTGIERIANAAASIRELKLGHIEIAAAPAMALSFLPHAIASFTRDHPDTLVSMHMHSTPIVLDMLQKGRCDLGFAMLPLRNAGYGNTEVLLSAKMVAAVPAHHSLARRKTLYPQDFAGEAFISPPPLLQTRNQLDSLFLSHGVDRRINIETPISYAIIKLVEAGAGLSIIDSLTALGYTGSLIKFIPFEPAITNDYSVIISARNASPLVLKPFLDHARKIIRKMVPKHLMVDPHS